MVNERKKRFANYVFAFMIGVFLTLFLSLNLVWVPQWDEYYAVSTNLQDVMTDYCQSQYGEGYEYGFTEPTGIAFGKQTQIHNITCSNENETYPDRFKRINIGDFQ